MSPSTPITAFEEIGAEFSLGPFAEHMQPLIKETLEEHGKAKWRKGTILLPQVSVWLVLCLTLRRDLNCEQVLNWMVSGFRWLSDRLPAKAKLVTNGTISHARVKLGYEVFETLFTKLSGSMPEVKADFFGRTSLIFDGSTGTMPDSVKNVDEFGKTQNQTGEGAFPQLRMMTLVSLSLRTVLDVAWAPYQGKGTGERTLMMQLLKRVCRQGVLYLMDAGLYSFELIWEIHKEQKQDFLAKLSSKVKPKFTKQLADGSYLAEVKLKVVDTDAPPRSDGRQSWKTLFMTVRVIFVQIPGFRPFRLVTSILDEDCTAYELAVHYHKRWDIEISYDEIKTHQCATRRGQSPTLFRSKRPDLVIQELYAIMISYNLVRLFIFDSANENLKDPRFISFLDVLHHLIEAIPPLTFRLYSEPELSFDYLRSIVADCDIYLPRRHRTTPRVVKVKSSKFSRKNSTHKTVSRNYVEDIAILPDTTRLPDTCNDQILTSILLPA